MISDLKKLSKDLIVYSALIAQFEKLDFKNDALAGVRANFFNSNHSGQSDKSDILSDSSNFSLSYTMNYGEPMLWKVMSNNRPYQTVKRNSDDVYCVLTYGDNGIVIKRMYFDNYHNWLATEYYDNERENIMLAGVKPVNLDGYACLKLDSVSADGKSTSYLYPSTNAPKKKCAGLVYSNFGMIWYDESFKPADVSSPAAGTKSEGFNFTVEDFTKPAVNPLDLQGAEYLSADDFEEVEPETEETPVENGGYSAYDKIESILFEAHKTNKNIFGEVVSQAAKDSAEAEETAQDSEPEQTPEITEEPVEKPPAPEVEPKEQPEPDSTLESPNGVYSYYGQLDEENRRIGCGRTVSPSGITVYEGRYIFDKRDGFGISYYKDGSPNYVGSWELGNRSGCGVGYRHSDGTMHVGSWTDNTPNGIGARFSGEGEFLDVCGYSMGVRSGKGISFDKDGNVVIKIYQDGEVIAEKTVTDDDFLN